MKQEMIDAANRILKDIPPQSELRKIFAYVDGNLIWRKRGDTKWDSRFAGAEVGSQKAGGYRSVTLNGQKYTYHRLVYVWHYGDIGNLLIDHIDKDITNNAIENLRVVTEQESNFNRTSKKGTSKYLGVSFCKRASKWRGSIKISGKSIHIGLFETEFEAARARDLYARNKVGEYCHLNFPLVDLLDVWTRFDPQDKSTWPKSEYAPSGRPWLCLRANSAQDGKPFVDLLGFNDAGMAEFSLFPQKRWALLDVLGYCDPMDFAPADILPQESE